MMRTDNAELTLWRTNGQGMDHSRVQRPMSRRAGYQQACGINFPQRGPPVILKQTYGWSKWPDVTVRLKNLHNDTTTYDIWRSFQMHGNLVLIEIYESRTSQRDGSGRIKFSPPPREPFWTRLGSHM